MSNARDRLEYYKTLGVSTDATEEQIKMAYEQLIEKHRSENGEGRAAEATRRISRAYEILGNAESRRTYDRSIGHNENTEEGGSNYTLLSCEGCATPSPHLKIVAISWVWSAILFTRHGMTPKMLCPQCANRQLCAAGTKTAILGWWGFPFGLIYTPIALFKNLLPGRAFLEENVQLSVHQAMALYQGGDRADASLAKAQATKMAAGQQHLERHIRMLDGLVPNSANPGEAQKWSFTQGNGMLRLLPLLVGTLLVGGVGAQLGKDSERQAKADAHCTALEAMISQEEKSLKALEVKLGTSGSVLSERQSQLITESASMDSSTFKTKSEEHMTKLISLKASIASYEKTIDLHNAKVEEYNIKCAT